MRFWRAAAVLLAIGRLRGAEQTTFEFHSSFWVNLHHVLYNQAAGRKDGRGPDFSGLSVGEAATWTAVLDYYGAQMATRELLDPAMTHINQALAAAGGGELRSGGRAIPAELAGVLQKAAPIYRARWWAAHDQKNREWIAQAEPLIAAHEAALRPAIARAYGTRWPKGRMQDRKST